MDGVDSSYEEDSFCVKDDSIIVEDSIEESEEFTDEEFHRDNATRALQCKKLKANADAEAAIYITHVEEKAKEIYKK